MTLMSKLEDSFLQGLRDSYAVVSEQDPVREGKFVSMVREETEVIIPGA